MSRIGLLLVVWLACIFCAVYSLIRMFFAIFTAPMKAWTIGKGYDWAGAFGIPLLMSEDWADDSKWWCSEHTFMMLMKGGTEVLDPSVFKRVTPEHLRMCNYPKSEILLVR